jgi:putative transposase
VCSTILPGAVCNGRNSSSSRGAGARQRHRRGVGRRAGPALHHKRRNLLAHAPERLHEEITADYNDMICAQTSQLIEARRKAFIRKMASQTPRRCRQPRGSRRTSVQLHPPASGTMEERAHHQRDRAPARGVQATDQDQTVLPSADTAAMLFWALLASGQINMRKIDGWKTLDAKPIAQPIDLVIFEGLMRRRLPSATAQQP